MWCSGDFWQLDPPDGGFLGGIPTEYIQAARKFHPSPSIAHGQSLLWSGPQYGLQGVTELNISERCDDAWLQEVQAELRCGNLSERNHAFLHGLPTSVPGSWTGGDVLCGNATCQDLIREGKKGRPFAGATMADWIQSKECEQCKEERRTRNLVARDCNDVRFRSEAFIRAPAVFANNDLKYEVNKFRANLFASAVHEAITYCPAKDTPSPEALRERPDLPAQKLSWLQRHDRESGDLYGIVTLVKGMPVALTDHIDRSTDKQLLRGKVGEIHSWVLHEQETSVYENGIRVLRKLPKVVFVKFKDTHGSEVEWKLPGLEEKGLYPVVSRKGSWYLDRGRQNPRLRITRSQFPLAPAFAMTAHGAQGRTLKDGAIVDLCIGQGTNSLGSYVAMTRVTRRDKVLLYRPFARDLFTQGVREGPDLLLKHLRGEKLDWASIEAKYTPSKRCSECNFVHFKEKFQPMQWARQDQLSVCKSCVEVQKAKRHTIPMYKLRLVERRRIFHEHPWHKFVAPSVRRLRRTTTVQ